MASPAPPAVPQRRPKSFEELFDSQRQVCKRRKEYPRRSVEDLIAWLTHAKPIVAAGRALFDTKDESASDAKALSAEKQKIIDSKEDILRCAKLSQHISKCATVLDGFLENYVVMLDGFDCDSATMQHSDWFASLCVATRHTTAAVHTLQTMLAENRFLGAGASSAETAASLSEAWAAAEDALDAEMNILVDTCADECPYLRPEHHGFGREVARLPVSQQG